MKIDQLGIEITEAGEIFSGKTWSQGWHQHNRRILTAEQVDRIKAWRKPVSARTIAKQFKVSENTIAGVWRQTGRFSNI